MNIKNHLYLLKKARFGKFPLGNESKKIINDEFIIECQNCGKYNKLDKIEQINIGKEQFYICNDCKDVIEKFKQRHKI